MTSQQTANSALGRPTRSSPRSSATVRLLGGGATLLALASPAAAQDAGRSLHVGVSTRGEYQSNIAHTSSVIAQQAGVRADDYIFVPSIDLDGSFPVGRASLFLTGDLGYDFHRNNKQLNQKRVSTDGGAQFALSRCSGSVRLHYGSHQTGTGSSVDPELPTTPLAGVNTQREQSVEVNASCGRAQGLAPSLGYEHNRVRNSARNAGSSTSITNSVTAGLRYGLGASGGLSATLAYSDVKFSETLLLPQQQGSPGYSVTSGEVSYDRSGPGRFSGGVSMGVVDLKSESPSAPDFRGTSYKLNVGYKAGARINTNLRLERRIDPSTGVRAGYTLRTGGSLQGDYRLTRGTLTLGASDFHFRSRGQALLPVASSGNEKTLTVFGVIRFKLRGEASLSLDARRERHTADKPEFNYSNSRVGVTLRAGF
jgi:hypothetical protein